MEGDRMARTCYKEQHQAATACWREYETHAADCSRSAASWYARQPNSTSVRDDRHTTEPSNLKKWPL